MRFIAKVLTMRNQLLPQNIDEMSHKPMSIIKALTTPASLCFTVNYITSEHFTRIINYRTKYSVNALHLKTVH